MTFTGVVLRKEGAALILKIDGRHLHRNEGSTLHSSGPTAARYVVHEFVHDDLEGIPDGSELQLAARSSAPRGRTQVCGPENEAVDRDENSDVFRSEKSRIVAMLGEHNGIKKVDLLVATGLTEATLSQALNELRSDGLVFTMGRTRGMTYHIARKDNS